MGNRAKATSQRHLELRQKGKYSRGALPRKPRKGEEDLIRRFLDVLQLPEYIGGEVAWRIGLNRCLQKLGKDPKVWR